MNNSLPVELNLDIIQAFREKLEPSEKVLLLGEGKRVNYGIRRVVTITGLILAVPLLPLTVFILSMQGLGIVAPDLILAAVGYGMYKSGSNHSGWYALTPNQLLSIEDDGDVRVVASRSEVERIEAADDHVQLFVKKQPYEKPFVVRIKQVQSLPEIVGK